MKCFCYWDNGPDGLPPMLKQIYNHNLKISKTYNFELILISKNNILQYIDVPPNFYFIPPNFQSDIARFHLLHKFGGCWIDTDVIILKNINQIYDNLLSNTSIECILDEELPNKIGCATIFLKPNSFSSQQLINYIEQNNLSNLHWNDIGPNNVTYLYEKYKDKVQLNKYDSTKFGCNYLTWKDNPGFNKQKWIFDKINNAEKTAEKIFNNPNCFYSITWTIYNKNNINDDICNFVFNNRNSIFHHLLKFSKQKLNILFSFDENELPGIIACIHSIIKNTNNLHKIHFYLLHYNCSKIKKILFKYFPNLKYQLFLHNFSSNHDKILFLQKNINTYGNSNPYIKNIMNFARFYLPDIFNVNYGLYMDADMIVQTDITNILKEINMNDFQIYAVFNDTFENMEMNGYEGPAFNAGIYFWNLKNFKNQKIIQKIENLIIDHNKNKKWKFGTQPILNTIYYKEGKSLDYRWNLLGLGDNSKKKIYVPNQKKVDEAFVLHWNGPAKPWKTNSNYINIFKKYNLI